MYLVYIFFALLGAAVVTGTFAWLGARRVTRKVRALRRPTDSVRALPLPAKADLVGDLRVYPERLGELEARLLQRHADVRRQIRALQDARGAMAEKGERDDLVKRYADDITALERRGDSMRRVAGVVWRTRSMLLHRVHVAGTARRRPRLGALPDADVARRDLVAASSTYRDAATQVRAYVELIDERIRQVDGVTPPEPREAEIDEALRRDVAEAREACLAEHRALRGRMDRLADELTWSADHFAAMRVMASEAEPVLASGPDRILDEVARAMEGVDKLTAFVDPKVADAAMTGLTEDIGRLEQAGLDARAEADARLEVERLVGGPR